MTRLFLLSIVSLLLINCKDESKNTEASTEGAVSVTKYEDKVLAVEKSKEFEAAKQAISFAEKVHGKEGVMAAMLKSELVQQEFSNFKWSEGGIFYEIQDKSFNLRELSGDFPILKEDLRSSDSELPKAYSNRKFIDKIGIEGYRGDLRNLIGLIATERNNGNYEIGAVDFKNNSLEFNIDTPEGGVLKEYKYDKNQVSTINWLLSVNLEDNELVHFTLEDISRAVLPSSGIDFDKIKRSFSLNDANIDKKYLIGIATVTEITSKKYTKRTRKIKVSEFPLIGSAISAGNDLFTSNLEFQRDYRIGLRLISIKNILEELPSS